MPASGAPINYYVVASLAGQDDLRSVVFGPSSDGEFTWDNLIFPADGTWALTLYDAADDSSVASDTVAVDAA